MFVCVCSHGLEHSGDNGLWGLSGAVMSRFTGLLGCQATGTQGLRALKTTVTRGSPGPLILLAVTLGSGVHGGGPGARAHLSRSQAGALPQPGPGDTPCLLPGSPFA